MSQLFSFEETPSSRSESYEPPTYTLIYRACGEQNQTTVSYHALGATPTAVVRPTGVLYRQNIEIEPDGWSNYLVTVPYGRIARDPGTVSFSFDTTGATINIKAAKEHVASFPVAGNFHKGSIGVKEGGEIEGADIVVPALKLTYGFKHPQGQVNEVYAKSIASITGTSNLYDFRTFSPGELLFLGGSGSDGTEADAEVGYQFAAFPNESAMRIGDIVDIVKKGTHYAWVEFKDEVESGEAVRQPKRVNIERVYDEVDWPSVFGWG